MRRSDDAGLGQGRLQRARKARIDGAQTDRVHTLDDLGQAHTQTGENEFAKTFRLAKAAVERVLRHL